MKKLTKSEQQVKELLSFVGTGTSCWKPYGAVSQCGNDYAEFYGVRHAIAAYKLQASGEVRVEYSSTDSVRICRRGFLGYDGSKRVTSSSIRVYPVTE